MSHFTGNQVFLNLKTAHTRHSYVQYENCDSIGIEFSKEHLAAVEKFDAIARCF